MGAGTVDLPASSSAPADDPLLAAALAFRDLEWRYLSSLSPERAERLKGRHRCFAVQHAVRFVEVYMVLCGAVPAALLACEGDDAYATELVATALTPVMHAHGLAARGYRALEARAPTCSTPRGWVFMAGAHARAGLVARVFERDPAGASPEDVAAALGWPTPRGSVPVMYVEMQETARRRSERVCCVRACTYSAQPGREEAVAAHFVAWMRAWRAAGGRILALEMAVGRLDAQMAVSSAGGEKDPAMQLVFRHVCELLPPAERGAWAAAGEALLKEGADALRADSEARYGRKNHEVCARWFCGRCSYVCARRSHCARGACLI